MSTLTFGDRCRAVFEELKIRRKHRHILFKMDDANTTVDIDSVGERGLGWADFKSALPNSDCRFGIYDHEFMSDRGVQVNKLWLVVWIPENSSAARKMMYTAAKTRFQESCLPGCFECQAATLQELEVEMGFKKEEVEKEEDFDF